MKTYKFTTVLCVLAISLTLTPSVFAADDSPTPSAAAVIADVVIARPACLVATVVGSTFFVVALPWTAISRSVKRSAEALVVKPAQATFTRKIGDFPTLADSDY